MIINIIAKLKLDFSTPILIYSNTIKLVNSNTFNSNTIKLFNSNTFNSNTIKLVNSNTDPL